MRISRSEILVFGALYSKQKNVPIWWLMAKDEGHGFLKNKNADFQFYATVRFVEEYLMK